MAKRKKKAKSHYAAKMAVRTRLAKRLGIPGDTPFPAFPEKYARSSDAEPRDWGGKRAKA